LARLPKGSDALEGAYKEAVERIDSQARGDRDLAHNVISWLVNAQRPLTTTELQHALAIEPGDHELDEDKLPVVEEMVSVCLGLVTIDDKSSIIRLVHYTTQHYFESLQVDWIASAPANIASLCITYLSFDVFASGFCRSDDEFMSRLAHNKFLAYAARHWADHVRGADEVKHLALKLLQSEILTSNMDQVVKLLKNPWKICDLSRQYQYPHKDTVLHLAAKFGILSLSKCLLEDGASPNAKNGFGETPLHKAARIGHTEVVKLLLTKNADANLQDYLEESALHIAVTKEHTEMVKLLLSSNANANLRNWKGETALHIATRKRHEMIVKLLLDNNANETW